MDDCIFCTIAKAVIPVEGVYEDDKAIAFLDINPVSNGHTLLIPREHHRYMSETPDALISHLFVKAKFLMTRLKRALNADYVVVSVQGIEVPHFHIHLIPRWHNDGLARFWPSKKYADGEAVQILKKIKQFI